MRILVVHNRYRSAAPSGENRVVDQETDALRSAGHDVEHFERLSDDIVQWSALERALLPVKVVYNGETRRSLGATIRRVRPDVVHVHNTFPVVSPSVLQACRQEGVASVVTIHNYKLLCASGDLFRAGSTCHDCVDRRVAVPALRHGCYRASRVATAPVVIGMALNRRAWRSLVSAYVFISEAQRQVCGSLDLPPDRVFVKHNLVPSISPPPDLEPAHQVAYLGRLDDAKGIPLLIRAWDRFGTAGAPQGLRLVVAGDGPLAPKVTAWARTRGDVDVVGMLSPAECRALLARARAVILPSEWEETFGLVAVEAMAAGVAPVASDHGSFPELIADGEVGVLFAAGDPAALGRVLGDVDAHPDRFAALGAAARLRYLSRFDPAQNLDQLLAIYRFAHDNPV